MTRFLFFLAGSICSVALALIATGVYAINRPDGAIANEGFDLITISSQGKTDPISLTRGESVRLPYGVYELEIPRLNLKLPLFKNDHGSGTLYQQQGVPVVRTKGVASLGGP